MTAEVDRSGFDSLLEWVKPRAAESGVFEDVRIDGGSLKCAASGSAEPATYRVLHDEGKAWVALEMSDRWQSESIEADLMNSGDSLEELLEEELVDQGYEGSAKPVFEHFRSDDMLFTFRSPIPLKTTAGDGAAETVSQWLLAYQACFAQLGDMSADEAD
ncbi:MAG: hypothetical protein CMJ31_04835 [Phycisphaerae bacterium]|nr:hypothetical protein [Phycisphaerae bacterium]